MRAWLTRGLLGTLTIAAAYGQGTPGQRPAFEVASVRRSPPANAAETMMLDAMSNSLSDMLGDGVPTDPSRTRVTLRRKTLASLIAMAYRIRATDIVGPRWIAEERFDIAARLPQGASSALTSEMMQSLLDERLALKIHWEKKREVVFE